MHGAALLARTGQQQHVLAVAGIGPTRRASISVKVASCITGGRLCSTPSGEHWRLAWSARRRLSAGPGRRARAGAFGQRGHHVLQVQLHGQRVGLGPGGRRRGPAASSRRPTCRAAIRWELRPSRVSRHRGPRSVALRAPGLLLLGRGHHARGGQSGRGAGDAGAGQKLSQLASQLARAQSRVRVIEGRGAVRRRVG